MNGAFRSTVGTRLSRWRRSRLLRNYAAVALIVLGPLLAGLTFLALGPFALSAGSDALRLVLLARPDSASSPWTLDLGRLLDQVGEAPPPVA